MAGNGVGVMAISSNTSTAGFNDVAVHFASAETPLGISKTLEAMISTQHRMAEILDRLSESSRPAEKTTNSAKPKREGRRGEKWSADEEDVIVSLFESGSAIDEIARKQGRSWVAIVARLEYLGYVPRNLRLADLEPKRKGSV
jgi:hypothetical protein